MSKTEMMATDSTIVSTLRALAEAAPGGVVDMGDAIKALRASGWPLASTGLRTLSERGEIVVTGAGFSLTDKLGAEHVPHARAVTEAS